MTEIAIASCIIVALLCATRVLTAIIEHDKPKATHCEKCKEELEEEAELRRRLHE